MNKKSFAIVLALVMVISLLPLNVFAVEVEEVDRATCPHNDVAEWAGNKICFDCGWDFNKTDCENLGHDYVDGVCIRENCGAEDPDYVAPVCNHEDGEYIEEWGMINCPNCGWVEVETEPEEEPSEPAHEHDFSKKVAAPEYATEEDGVYYFSCECGEAGTETWNQDGSTGGDVEEGLDPATCPHEGRQQWGDNDICWDCGYNFKKSVCENLGHNYVNGACDVCGEADPDAVPEETDPAECEHVWKKIASAEAKAEGKTCEHGDLYYYTCDACGELSEDTWAQNHETVDHNYVEGKCEWCGAEEPKCEHDFVVQSSKMGTCTEEGLMIEVCDLCGETRETVFPIDEDNHNYEDGVCSRCGAEEPEEEPSEPETECDHANAYYVDGWGMWRCDDCSSWFEEDPRPAEEPEEPADEECTHPNLVVDPFGDGGPSYCPDCEQWVETPVEEEPDVPEEPAECEHVWKKICSVEAKAEGKTCQHGDLYHYTCELCGEISEDTWAQNYDTVDHHYVDGECEWCGAEEPVEEPETVPSTPVKPVLPGFGKIWKGWFEIIKPVFGWFRGR